jgi:hypothetical protein
MTELQSPSDAVQHSGVRIRNKIRNTTTTTKNNNKVPKYIIKHYTMQAYRGEYVALSSTNLEIVCREIWTGWGSGQLKMR